MLGPVGGKERLTTFQRGGREGGREGEREGGRDGGREGGREKGGREKGRREGGRREGGRQAHVNVFSVVFFQTPLLNKHLQLHKPGYIYLLLAVKAIHVQDNVPHLHPGVLCLTPWLYVGDSYWRKATRKVETEFSIFRVLVVL